MKQLILIITLETLIILNLFKYKDRLSEIAIAQAAPNAANGILKSATIAVPLKYLSNFWRSLEISLINCEVELKLRWTKHCVLSVAGTGIDNGNNDNNHIIFTVKDKKLLCVPVVTLSARDNQRLSKRLSKGFERLVYFYEYKTKSDNENTTNKFRCFLKSNFLGVIR